MRTDTIFSIAAIVFLLSCQKQEEDLPGLHLDTTVVTAGISGGDKTVQVRATGAWTAEFEEETDWVFASCQSGEGNGEIVLHFEPNPGEFRFVYLKVSLIGTDLIERVSVNQEAVAGSPIVRLTQPQDYYPSEGGIFELSYFSNRAPEDLKIETEPEVDWISDTNIGTDRISFRLSENSDQVRRSVVLWLVHEDIAGNRFKDKCTIVQKAREVSEDKNIDSDNESYGIDSEEVNWM